MDTTSRAFQPFPSQVSLRTPLPEHNVPGLDDLLALEQELAALQARTVSRAKKAETDLLAFETMYRKAKEREKIAKGKIKIKDKDRDRERDRDRDVEMHRGDKERDRERGPLPNVKIKREHSGKLAVRFTSDVFGAEPLLQGTPDRDSASIASSSRIAVNGNRKP